MISKPATPEFGALSLKWKSWRWYLAILFNISVPAFLTLFKILSSNNTIQNDTGKVSFVSVFIPISITFLVAYIVASIKFKCDYSVLIKEERFKYFWRGISSSFLSCCFLVIGLVILIVNDNDKAIFYSCVGLSCISGTISSVFITIYEFCVNWDIFYSKNRETIVKEYLKRQNKFKIEGEEREGDEG